MFRSNKPKSGRSSDRIAFSFSNFQALQVPKEWDRVFVSLVHVQTGKTLAKLGKASVRNGKCRWSETLTETLNLSETEENGTNSKELEEHFIKFVIATGTSRSGVLGEANVNVARYANSKATVPLSLPLSKCDYGTTLQLKLQCLTPRTKVRDGKGRNPNSEVSRVDDDDMDAKSDGSESISFVSRSVRSSSSNHRAENQTGEQTNSQERSLSASGSWRSSDSTESGRDNTPRSSSGHNTPSSMSSSYANNQREELGGNSNSPLATSPCSIADSTKDLEEAAQVSIEELQAEARMWERNAKKSALDVEVLRNDLSEQSQKGETLEMELSTMQKECSSLKQEIARLNHLLNESDKEREANEDRKLQDNNSHHAQKEMQDELRFHQESSADLAEQLQKTQDSNVELLSILQELEGIVETQKTEIETLSAEKLELQERADGDGSTGKPRETKDGADDSHLRIQLQKLLECQEEFEGTILELQKELEDKIRELEAKDEQIKNFESQVSRTPNSEDGDLAQQVDFLKGELDRLETDCSELVEENMQLVEQLKEERKKSSPSDHLVSSSPGRIDSDRDLRKKLAAKASEAKALKSDCRVKAEQIGSLRQRQTELEDEISSLREEKNRSERERSDTNQVLDELKNEVKMLKSGMEAEVGTNEILWRRISDLEKGKQDLERHISDFEDENMQLSERLSALEAQLRYLTDQKESCRVELEHAEEQIEDLNGEIDRLENEMEAQKTEMEQKLNELEKQWLEVQEECEYRKEANSKLEITIENLMEECNSIQKSNADLKLQNHELNKRRSMLEAQVRDAEEKLTRSLEKISGLDAEISKVLDKISLKEKSMNSELELLAYDNKEYKQKLIAQENFLNQMYSEKVLEAEKLQAELVHLIDQISSLYGPYDKKNSDSMLELSTLRSEKAKLESVLGEVRKKLASTDEQLKILQIEYVTKVEELTTAATSSRQKYESISAEHENLLKSSITTKSSEENYKNVIRLFEMNLKEAEYDRKQLAQEVGGLKLQLQKAMLLQNDVLAHKKSLAEAKSENEKLKKSYNALYNDHEKLKTKKISVDQKISSMGKTIKELEEIKRKKFMIEEKVFRLEGDISVKEALCTQNAEMKIETTRIKRANNELQRKIKLLEEEKEELQKKAAIPPVASADTSGEGSSEQVKAELLSRIQVLEHELNEAAEANEMYKDQLKRLMSEENTPAITPKATSDQQNGSNNNAAFMLEMELRDLREKYFQMSLRYAEVEAEREQLVLKLKSSQKRRWF